MAQVDLQIKAPDPVIAALFWGLRSWPTLLKGMLSYYHSILGRIKKGLSRYNSVSIGTQTNYIDLKEDEYVLQSLRMKRDCGNHFSLR